MVSNTRSGGTPSFARPDAIDVYEDVRRGAAEGREHARQPWVGVRRSNQISGRRFQGGRAKVSSVLQHHLEATRAANAVHRGWLHGDDETVFDTRKPLIDGCEDHLRCQALLLSLLEGLEDRENCP